MLDYKNLSIPLIIGTWAPGLIFLWSFFPLLIYYNVFTNQFMISSLVLALPIGLLLIAAKMYRFVPGYRQIKEEFHQSIKEVLNIEDSGDYAFIVAIDLVEKQGRNRLNYYRCYWTFVSLVSVCFLIAGVSNLIVFFIILSNGNTSTLHLITFGVFTILFIIYNIIGKSTLEKSNMYFIKFISSEKGCLRKCISDK